MFKMLYWYSSMIFFRFLVKDILLKVEVLSHLQNHLKQEILVRLSFTKEVVVLMLSQEILLKQLRLVMIYK
ncbi:MAG: hypothetical protein CBE16_00105 [Rhodospirillaceae bacterium TMED256]|nr:MAG: hypothetical protein CBE16_00105 [Rhodospirillaceae bacterium TMED256]